MSGTSSLSTLMELRLRAGDFQLSRGRTAFVTSPTGTVLDNPHHGLFVYETRVLGRYRWLMNNEDPEFACGSNIEQHSWMAYYIQAPRNWKETPAHESSPLQQTIELRIKRFVGEGMREHVQLTNHTQISTEISLDLGFEPQFISREEAEHGRQQHGNLSSHWSEPTPGTWELNLDYVAEHHYEHQGNTGDAQFSRGLILRIEQAGSPPVYSNHRIHFGLSLEPRENWRCCISWIAVVEHQILPLDAECSGPSSAQQACTEFDRKTSSFLSGATLFSIGPGHGLQCIVQRATERAKLDLAALRLFDLEKQGEAAVAAGVPTYMGVFGRDMLASAWQASLLGPELALGGLDVLGHRQASEVNDWRDAQPGRIVHEVHTDPLSVLNFRSKTLYFGSVSTSLLYPILLSELWHTTGDLELVRPYVDAATRALKWADEYSLDHTGFYRYQTHSDQGMKNQGWKDSQDAIVYPDGSQVPTPIGTCEMQAFAYAAKLSLSELFWWLNDKRAAAQLYSGAIALKQRFNAKFWMEDEGFLAMAIDKHGELVRSIASDPGHCLLSGIVDESRVPRLANRLLKDDLFSGWGIRTLSAEHPAYNPFSYHRGSVWPVENGSFVLGFARYGLHGEMHRLARSLFEAASLFPHCRLPEVFGGHQRTDEAPFPGLYTKADWPQAWSASAVFAIIRAILGLYPYAPANLLVVDPHLPDWLPEMTVENFRVGKALASIRFHRTSEGSSDYQVLELTGKLHILRQPSPWSLTTDWAERVKDTAFSLSPKH